jgi:hypothetical protein
VHYAFLPSGRACLLSILAACPANALVISSTWRLEGRRQFDTVLRLKGCGELIERLHEDWRTCEPGGEPRRGDRQRPSILGQDWGILVDPTVGLSETHIAEAIARLQDEG